jgi:hypothetical protein
MYYSLSYFNGSSEVIEAADDDDAQEAALAMITVDHPFAVAADQWDDDGWLDDEPQKRLLIWASQADASNDDDGEKAIAQLETAGRA